jgi:Glycosyltransferases involved in cell wall biogenesis
VQAQTHPIHEIVIVDDASRDATDRLVASEAAASKIPLRYVRNASNLGTPASRNVGIRTATGAWVAMLDSDDVWFPEKIERQLAASAERGNPARAVVYGQVRTWVAGKPRDLPPQGIAHGERVADYWFVGAGLMQASSLLVPRSFALEVGFDEVTPKHEDFAFTLRAEAAGATFIYCPGPLSVWTADQRSARLSVSLDTKLTEAFLEAYAPSFSDAARAAFRAKVIAPRLGRAGRRRDALRALMPAVRSGVLTPAETMRIAAFALLPYRLQRNVRNWLYERTWRAP